VLIKDNQLALGATDAEGRYSPAEAIDRCRQFIASMGPAGGKGELLIEIEVDTLEQLEEVLPKLPDVVLLDNMTPAELRAAVARRDALAPNVQLEASGGVTLESIAEIARSGVDRISSGALTHSAPWLDIALDWA
jgi:nicotinate-nucleotide pyrophosphorylase (carboxylating)